MCAFCHSVHTLTMTGFGRVSPAQTELSGWPNKQPRAVLRDSSFRFEEEPRQKAQAMSERLLLNGFPEKSEEMTAAQKAWNCNALIFILNFFDTEWMILPVCCCGGSTGRALRMNWNCLYTCSCSAFSLSAGGAAASLPPPWEYLTWLMWMLKGNSWPKRERRRDNSAPWRLSVVAIKQDHIMSEHTLSLELHHTRLQGWKVLVCLKKPISPLCHAHEDQKEENHTAGSGNKLNTEKQLTVCSTSVPQAHLPIRG